MGGSHYNKSSGITPPLPSPVAITSGPDPPLLYALCIAISARGHSGFTSPRKKGHVPFLVVAAPPLVRLRLPPLVRFDGWLSRHLLSHCLHLASRAAISRSLNAWLHRRCPFRIAVAPSIAVAVALPSCRPSPPSLVDCCRFHCHHCVNIHPPLLPSRLLCCACHRRPSHSRHPSLPLLVDCCIFHVHCRIAIHHRCSVAQTIAINTVAVALPSCCSCALPLSLVDSCLAVGSHCNRCGDTSTAIALLRLPSPLSLSPSHLCRAFNRCRRCITVAPSIAIAIHCYRVVHCLRRKCLAAGNHYDGIVCSLPCRHSPTAQEEKDGVPPQYGYALEVFAPMLLL